MDIKYIEETIEKLKDKGADLIDDYAHFTDRYKRYLSKFKKAKELIALSNDVSHLFPLENPRELIYKACKDLTEIEKKEFLAKFERTKIDFNIIFEFDDLERLEQHIPPKS